MVLTERYLAILRSWITVALETEDEVVPALTEYLGAHQPASTVIEVPLVEEEDTRRYRI